MRFREAVAGVLRPWLAPSPRVVSALCIAVFVAGCGGSSATSSATEKATLRLGSDAPIGSGLVQPSVEPSLLASRAPASVAPSARSTSGLASHGVGAPTQSAATQPSTSPDSSASAASSEPPFPNSSEAILLDHVKDRLRPSCDRTDQFYADEIDSVSCGGDTVPFADYTLFGTVDELRAAYIDDVQQSESKPTDTGTCATANYEATYSIAGTAAGRLQCTTRLSNSGETYKVIEWTRENLRILAYLSSATATWDQMITFWKTEAGPVD